MSGILSLRGLTILRDNFLGTRIDSYKEETYRRNYVNFKSFSVLGLIVAVIISIISLMLKDVTIYREYYVSAVLYFAFLNLMCPILKKHIEQSVKALYAALVPVMILGIVMSTLADRGEISVSILVFICVLPLFILDKPWRIILFITLVSLTYGIVDFWMKMPFIFVGDLTDLIFFYLMGSIVNFTNLVERINNVENFMNLRVKSEYDSLTSLLNRGTGENKVSSLMNMGRGGMFCIMDIDNFKAINDTYGHKTGDIALQKVAEKLTATFRSEDILFRLGGDEFAVYAKGVTDSYYGARVIDRLFTAIKEITIPDIETFHLSISLGATFYTPGDDKGFDTLYKESDRALYRAKNDGKGKYMFEEQYETALSPKDEI